MTSWHLFEKKQKIEKVRQVGVSGRDQPVTVSWLREDRMDGEMRIAEIDAVWLPG